MGFTVRELLQTEILKNAKVVAGKGDLDNEIEGVTIIEAPDIVKFIDGGEVLLTGLYAFKDCSIEEFKQYLADLTKKTISALILKRGRKVENAAEKITLLSEFAESHNIPIIEVPFEVGFRDIMSLIMERLFNEEVTMLKYFKTTHDNFTALTLSFRSSDKGIERILDVLAKLIRNPVAVFNHDKMCIATTNDQINTISINEDAVTCEPGFYSSYTYLKQRVCPPGEVTEGDHQYLVLFEVTLGVKLYLVITELNPDINTMDYIAIENAITALRQEFSRQHAINELEKKFHNDILFNILNGKVHSKEELQKSVNLLGMPLDGSYRLIIMSAAVDDNWNDDINSKMVFTDILSDAVRQNLCKAKICNDFDKLIIIHQQEREKTEEEYRDEIKQAVEKIQKQVARHNKYLKVKAGLSRTVSGIENISKGHQEASDALMFVDIACDISGSEPQQVTLFSDLGIFKLLCQLSEPEQFMEYVPDSLRKLYEYKKPQREDLLITLKTYLDRNQSLAKTAQDLFIHYKTAAYRIEKISKLTHIDFDNANEILAVRIGLIVYKMMENYNKKLG